MTIRDEQNGRGAVHYVCRCEEVLAVQIESAMAGGATTLNDIKRLTRAGMGLCQGIYCLAEIARMLETTAEPGDLWVAPMTSRPPARPIPLALLADSAPSISDTDAVD